MIASRLSSLDDAAWQRADPLAPRPSLDPAGRVALAALCDAVEAEVVTLTRRLGACEASAREAARDLGAELAALAERLAGALPAADEEGLATRIRALANLAASLEADLARTGELVHALPRRVLPLLRGSVLTDRRRHPRTPVARTGSLLLGGRRGACLTLDLSEGGALVRPQEPWPELDDVTGLAELELDGVGRLPALLVARSPLGVHLAFRTCAPPVRAALAQLLREARRAERALLGLARRIVDDLASWWLEANGPPMRVGPDHEPSASVPAEERIGRALQVLDLHRRREPRLVAAWLFAPDGRELAAHGADVEDLPWEPAPEPPERGAPRCRVVPPPFGTPGPAWMKVEAAVGDAVRTIGTLRLLTRA